MALFLIALVLVVGFATRLAPGRVLVAWLTVYAIISTVLMPPSLFSWSMIALGIAAASIVRDPPRCSTGTFGLVSFRERSFVGRAIELEWLGFKLLIAAGRLPPR